MSQVDTLVRGDPTTDVRCPLGQYDGVVQRPPRRSPSHGQTAEVGANVANNEVADSYLQRVNSGFFPVVVERDSKRRRQLRRTKQAGLFFENLFYL